LALTAYGETIAVHSGNGALAGTSADAALSSMLYNGERFDNQYGGSYFRGRLRRGQT